MDYPFLEKAEYFTSEPVHYRLAPDIVKWIEKELYKRQLLLQEKFTEEKVEIYKTLRRFKKRPVFVMGYEKEGNKFIIEAWGFAYVPPENLREVQVQWVLDYVPKDLFKSPPKKPRLST